MHARTHDAYATCPFFRQDRFDRQRETSTQAAAASLRSLQVKERTVLQSMEALVEGIQLMSERVRLANKVSRQPARPMQRHTHKGARTSTHLALLPQDAYCKVRSSFSRFFSELVVGYEADLLCSDPEALLDLRPVIRTILSREAAGEEGRGEEEGAGEQWRSAAELSGGQRTLLNLSLLLAAAR